MLALLNHELNVKYSGSKTSSSWDCPDLTDVPLALLLR